MGPDDSWSHPGFSVPGTKLTSDHCSGPGGILRLEEEADEIHSVQAVPRLMGFKGSFS